MVTALDTSVILDVVCNQAPWADAAERAVRAAMAAGTLIVCECVVAELQPALGAKRTQALMEDWGIRFVPSSEKSAILAGTIFARYKARGGTARTIVADFLIGAHAQVYADRLLARDRGYLRDYFTGLRVVAP